MHTAQALTTLAAHRAELTSLVSNGEQGLKALGAEQASLQRGVHELPGALQQGNRAFAQLPSTFAALRKLAEVARPDTKKLATFFAKLTPLVNDARPVLHNLSVALSRPGPSNDLTDTALALPAFAQALVNGSPSDVKALQESVPVTAFFGPYAPDLPGFVRTFGTTPATTTPTASTRASAPCSTTSSSAQQHAQTDHSAGRHARSAYPRTAPLPRLRRDALAGRRLGAVHRQRPARLRPHGGAVMNRRRRDSLAASPLLIGALTMLIAVVAVYISYNANNGLPFTPTYEIKAELPESSGLEKGNEVRLSGRRIGIVSGLVPHQNPHHRQGHRDRQPKLEKKAGPLPADTTMEVESVSTIGLKYLELKRGTPRGRSRRARRSPSRTHANRCRSRTSSTSSTSRRGSRSSRTPTPSATPSPGAASGSTKRSTNCVRSSNNAIPVLHNLASPQTGFGQLFIALDKTAWQVAPVAEQQASLFRELDTFFTALAGAAPALERTIEGGPAALHQAIYSFPAEEPFIAKATEFVRLLRPSAKILTTVATPLGHAFKVGAVNLHAAAALNAQLASSLQALELFSKNPLVLLGFEEFTRTAELGKPLFAGLAPAQTNCNYITLAFRNLANLAVREHRQRHGGARGADSQPLRSQQRGAAGLRTRQRALGR